MKFLAIVLSSLFICLSLYAKHLPPGFDFNLFFQSDPPVAVLPSDMSANSGALVSISGTSSTGPEGVTLEYRWSFDTAPVGSNSQMNNPTASSISFTADLVGLYIVKLTVFDNKIGSEPAYVSVRVSETNLAPNPGTIWYQQKDEDGLPAWFKIGLDGASDPDGEIVAYEYDFGDGDTSYVTSEEHPFTRTLFHVYHTAGTYPVKVTSIDNKGARSSVVRNITIRSNKAPRPIFSASVILSQSSSESHRLQLNGSQSTDPDGTITRYRWEIEGPAGEQEYSSSSATQVHSVPVGQEGEYHIRLTIDDNDRAYRYCRGSIYVGPNPPSRGTAPVPVILASARSGTVPLTVELDGSHSFDLEGDTFKAYWHFGDYAALELGRAGKKVSYTYKKPGKYHADLSLVDSHGNISIRGVAIYVLPLNAEENVTTMTPFFTSDGAGEARMLSFEPVRGLSPKHIHYENFLWDFGDGSKARGTYQDYQYAQEGTYIVTLTTIDGDGVRRKARKAVTVRNDRKFPQSSINIEHQNFPVNTKLTLDHSESASSTGAPLKFSYSFGDGTPFVFDIEDDRSSHVFSSQGAFQIFLYTEEEGRSSVDEIIVYPSVGIAPTPRYKLDKRVGVAPFTVNFDAAPSTDDGSIQGYYWYFGEDFAENPNQYAKGVQASHTYNQVGNHYARLTVIDNSGNINVRYEEIIILQSLDPSNQAPVASFTFTTDDLLVSFEGESSSDSDGSILFYEWDFGDGQISSGDYTEYSFMRAGSYIVTLKVTDDKGGVHSTSQTITVTDSGNRTRATKGVH